MRFRHLRRNAGCRFNGIPCIKVDDLTLLYIDDEGYAHFREIHDGTQVEEIPPNRFMVTYVTAGGGFDPSKFQKGTGKYLARIRVKNGNSILVVGTMSTIDAKIAELTREDNFAALQLTEEIRDNEVLTEREFEKFCKLQDALELLKQYN